MSRRSPRISMPELSTRSEIDRSLRGLLTSIKSSSSIIAPSLRLQSRRRAGRRVNVVELSGLWIWEIKAAAFPSSGLTPSPTGDRSAAANKAPCEGLRPLISLEKTVNPHPNPSSLRRGEPTSIVVNALRSPTCLPSRPLPPRGQCHTTWRQRRPNRLLNSPRRPASHAPEITLSARCASIFRPGPLVRRYTAHAAPEIACHKSANYPNMARAPEGRKSLILQTAFEYFRDGPNTADMMKISRPLPTSTKPHAVCAWCRERPGGNFTHRRRPRRCFGAHNLLVANTVSSAPA